MLPIRKQKQELLKKIETEFQFSHNGSYKCKFCGLEFFKGCALGGHIAKVHKGMKDKNSK